MGQEDPWDRAAIALSLFTPCLTLPFFYSFFYSSLLYLHLSFTLLYLHFFVHSTFYYTFYFTLFYFYSFSLFTPCLTLPTLYTFTLSTLFLFTTFVFDVLFLHINDFSQLMVTTLAMFSYLAIYLVIIQLLSIKQIQNNTNTK